MVAFLNQQSQHECKEIDNRTQMQVKDGRQRIVEQERANIIE